MNALLKKLRVESGNPIWLINAPDNVTDILGIDDYNSTLAGKNLIDQVLLFAYNQKDLRKYFPKLESRVAENAVIWIAYPKKAGGISSDLVRDEAWNIVFRSGLQFVSSVSIDDIWTGMRLKKKDPEKDYVRDVPMNERKTEGIDYVKRTVQLPKDAVVAMTEFKGLEEFFNSMSFSHKKEYAEAIAEAKKPETRQRRIGKMIDMLNKLKEAKENKKKK